MSNEEKLVAIKKQAKATIAIIKTLNSGNGTFENPVDMDMVKTEKAMFFERVLEILKTK